MGHFFIFIVNFLCIYTFGVIILLNLHPHFFCLFYGKSHGLVVKQMVFIVIKMVFIVNQDGLGI